jgi:hypothetical protein
MEDPNFYATDYSVKVLPEFGVVDLPIFPARISPPGVMGNWWAMIVRST